MATALRPVMPMENEAMLIESAMYARRTVMQEARHDWNELMLQAEDALTFLEDQAIAVRVDIQHKVVTRV